MPYVEFIVYTNGNEQVNTSWYSTLPPTIPTSTQVCQMTSIAMSASSGGVSYHPIPDASPLIESPYAGTSPQNITYGGQKSQYLDIYGKAFH